MESSLPHFHSTLMACLICFSWLEQNQFQFKIMKAIEYTILCHMCEARHWIFLIQKVETFVHLLSVQETEFFWSKNWNFCTFTSCEGNWIFLIQKMWTFLHLLPVKTIMIHLGRPGRTWDSWVAWGIFLPKEQTNIYFSFVGFIYSVDLLVWRHTFSCCMLFI